MNREIKEIGVYVLDNRGEVISFLNRNGYSNLPSNAPLSTINDVIADNMFSEHFWNMFVDDMQRNSGYSNWLVEVVGIVTQIGVSINKMFVDAKMALFQRNMMSRQEVRNRETEQFYKDLAELNAKKQMAIELGVAQQDVLLKRELQREKGKRYDYLIMFGLFVGGALTIGYIIRKKNK